MKAAVGPDPIPAMTCMPTMATAYNAGLRVSISGITTSAHGMHAVQPTNIKRRRPTRSDRVAEVATDVMLARPPSAATVQMRLREYPRWECAYMVR